MSGPREKVSSQPYCIYIHKYKLDQSSSNCGRIFCGCIQISVDHNGHLLLNISHMHSFPY